MKPTADAFSIDAGHAGITIAGFVRAQSRMLTWSQARQVIASRRVCVNKELCLDPARRLKEGDTVELFDNPQRLPVAVTAKLVIRHLDEHIVVVEKPAGMSTTRHPAERHWSQRRRELSPTLDDRVQKHLALQFHKPLHKLPRLRKVHRLDKLTSGLLVFARSALAERELGRQFHAHTVDRRYQAIVHGRPKVQVIRSLLVRDRGDGRRGSSKTGEGKPAVTHIENVEPLGKFSLVACRLETGRTHQIRIHLAELGHAVLGDPVYGPGDSNESPRLALHAAELGFRHPGTGEQLHWTMPLPRELRQIVDRLRRASG